MCPRKYPLSFIAGVIFMLCGCTTETIFVVRRDVPEKPSCVVIPGSYMAVDVDFADGIEAIVIQGGISVLTRPGQKEVITEKGAGQAQTDEIDESTRATGATVTEKYFAWHDTDADYAILTRSRTERIRIVKMDTKEVLSSFVVQYEKALTGGRGDVDRDFIWKALEAVGIPVRYNKQK